MIHILNKVYISYAETSVGPNHIARLPEGYVRIVDKGISFMQESLYAKEEIAYGKTIAEVFSNYDSDEHFFRTLLEHISLKKTPKVIIYLDENSMLEFLIRWWKAIFPDLTAEGGYALYKVFSDSETLRPAKSTESFLDITVKSDRITFDKFVNEYWNEGKQSFTDKFNSYPAFNVPLHMKNQTSAEYLIMGYMLNPGEINPALMSKLTSMYDRVFVTEIYTLARKIQHFLYYLASKNETLHKGTLLDGTSLKDTLALDSRYNLFVNYEVQDTRKALEYITANFELQKICTDLIDETYTITEDTGISDRLHVESDDPCVAFYATNGRHPYIIDELLQDEIYGHHKYKLFHRLIHKNRFNPFVIPAFRNLIADRGIDHPSVQEFKFAST